MKNLQILFGKKANPKNHVAFGGHYAIKGSEKYCAAINSWSQSNLFDIVDLETGEVVGYSCYTSHGATAINPNGYSCFTFLKKGLKKFAVDINENLAADDALSLAISQLSELPDLKV